VDGGLENESSFAGTATTTPPPDHTFDLEYKFGSSAIAKASFCTRSRLVRPDCGL